MSGCMREERRRGVCCELCWSVSLRCLRGRESIFSRPRLLSWKLKVEVSWLCELDIFLPSMGLRRVVFAGKPNVGALSEEHLCN